MKIYDTCGNIAIETIEEKDKKYEELFEQLDSILKEEELDELPLLFLYLILEMTFEKN